MSLNPHSWWFRTVSVLTAASLVSSISASGFVALAQSTSEAASWALRGPAPAYTEKPTAIFRGAKPGRDVLRTHWFNPQLRSDLVRAQSEEAIEQALARGEIESNIDLWLMPALVMQQNGGPGGDLPGDGEGEGPGDGPGMGGTGGLGGETNTHTGNKSTTVDLVNWTGRGNSGVHFVLTHGSVGTYNGTMGKSWCHSYDIQITYSLGSSAMVRMPDGLTIPYSQVGSAFNPPSGWNHELVRNANGTWVLTFKDQVKFDFNAAGSLVAVRDRNGNTTTVTRDAANLVQAVSTPDGRTLDFDYNAENRVSRVTDPTGRTWDFTYNANGQLVDIEFPILGGVEHKTSFTYNSNDDILTQTDLRGKVWTWTYDGAGKVVTSKTPRNETTSFTYAPAATTITFPNGTTQVDNYSAGLLASSVDPAGFSESYVYNANRDVLESTDQAGKKWIFTYDTKGNLLTAKNPLNQTWSYVYNSAHSLLSVTDPQGNATTFTYDGNQNLLTVKNALNQTRLTRTHNSFGQVLSSADALGRTIELSYNTNGDVVSISDPADVVSTQAFDALNRTVWVRDSGANQTSFTYDNWGRLIRIDQPDNSFSTSAFNLHGQPVTATDETGRQNSWSYNDNGDLDTFSNGRGDVESYQINNMRRVTHVVNGRGKTRVYSHNSRGQVQSLTMPDGSVEQWSYAARGEISRYTNPLGQHIDYAYDDAGRNVLVNYPTGTDTSFSFNSAGRRTQMSDSTGVTSWSYDSAGQVTQLSQPQGTLAYSYNSAGQRTSQSGAGQSQSWSFDASTGRMLSHTNGFGEATSYSYDSHGRVNQKTYSAGHREHYTFDNRGRLSSVAVRNSSNALLRQQNLSYDTSSRLISHEVGGSTTTFGYDGAGQLLSESRPGYSGAYTYDGNGNRLTRTINGVQEVYSYDDGDKLLGVKIGGVAVKQYSYDAAGRTTSVVSSAGTTTLVYDFESRATSITGPSLSQSNVYNGLDTRVGSTTNSVSKTFLRDGAYVTNPVLADGAAFYTPGVSERRGSSTTFLHSGLKSVDSQTNASQVVSGAREYDAFGNVYSTTGSWSGPFGYAGAFGYQEDNSGLKLLGHRYLDSSTSRFLTRDPIKDGRNWYVYADSNPVNMTDPTGLAWETFYDIFCVGVSGYHFIKDPSLENGIGLFLDVVAAATPVLPAGAGASRHLPGLGRMGEFFASANKSCPNQYGKRGAPPHQNMVQKVQDQLSSLPGFAHKHGGTEPEVRVDCNGRNRYADLVFMAPDGCEIAIQIGKQRKDTLPIKRERDAIADLEKRYGAGRVFFFPYN